MLTVLEIIKRSTCFLADKGVENPRLNAEHLIGHALGLKRMQLYLQFERPLGEEELEKIRPLVKRRSQREPLQYIMGEADFFGVDLKLDARALIPRPETELLVALIVEKLKTSPECILDLGTGTGAIALSLARHYPAAQVTALDVSSEAVALATENTSSNQLADRVTVMQSDWFTALEPGRRFDLIVSNPPYLSAEETEASAPEIKQHEPAVALSPGIKGIEALEIIIPQAPSFLLPGGLIAMETGTAQHDRLRELFAQHGFANVEFAEDMSGRPRFAFARSI